jgi:hypothetical protein
MKNGDLKKDNEKKDIEYNGKIKNFSIQKSLNKFLEKIKKEFSINNSKNIKLYAKVKNNLNFIEILTDNSYKNFIKNPDFMYFLVIDSNNQNQIEKTE